MYVPDIDKKIFLWCFFFLKGKGDYCYENHPQRICAGIADPG